VWLWDLRLARLHEQGDIDGDDLQRIVQRTADTTSPTNRDVLLETIAYGGQNGARVIAELDDLTPLYRFDADAGEDGIDLIRRFDDPQTARRFFEIEDIDGYSGFDQRVGGWKRRGCACPWLD